MAASSFSRRPRHSKSAATAPLFERARPALLCIDEAHCISEWGHDLLGRSFWAMTANGTKLTKAQAS